MPSSSSPDSIMLRRDVATYVFCLISPPFQPPIVFDTISWLRLRWRAAFWFVFAYCFSGAPMLAVTRSLALILPKIPFIFFRYRGFSAFIIGQLSSHYTPRSSRYFSSSAFASQRWLIGFQSLHAIFAFRRFHFDDCIFAITPLAI